MIFRQKNSCSSEHGKLCFGAPEIISGTPKQLATRLEARDGLHSEVAAPEDEKARTKNKNKLPLYTDRFAKRTTAEKENELYLCFSSIATRISSFSDIMSRD